MQYRDTSTLLKLFGPEPDSPQFAAHVASAICISQVGQAELLRAIVRKEMDGAIPAMSAETAFGRFLADVSAGRCVVRTLDAIHLASARLLPANEVVTLDSHMRAGANALGLKLFP